MDKNIVTTKEIIEEFSFEIINPDSADLTRVIGGPSIQRMGLELAGKFVENKFTSKLVIVWGTKEYKYFSSLSDSEFECALSNVISNANPIIILSVGFEKGPILDALSKYASNYGVPIATTDSHVSDIISNVGWFLSKKLAPSIIVHGTLMQIHGIGVMIIGPSGIGKSETALELVQRGHIFISDDSVIIRRIGDKFVGQAAPITKGYLESRGIGLIDMKLIYGAQLFKSQNDIHLVVEFLPDKHLNEIDRLGNQELRYEVLNSYVPKIQIPITQGRSAASLVVAATATYIAKINGMDPLKDIQERTRKNV